MMKYRKKPIVVEAVQWTGENQREIQSFVPSNFIYGFHGGVLRMNTVKGMAEATPGDFVIRDITGYYPCKAEEFEALYEPMKEEK